jgi:lipopolysaccharide transport system ATP-binding protein
VSEPVVVFNNVSKEYPLYHHITGGFKRFLFNLPEAIRSMRRTSLKVFEQLTFSIEKGETFGILGRNGAGKSTTLGLMAGVIRPTSGTVKVRQRVSPLLELGSGFHPELTGLENIELNGVLLGLSRREVLARRDQIIEFSEIGEHILQPIRTYSTGMIARLGFSVVAHLDPQLMLIDEVLAVGDIAFREKCTQKMQSFKEQGVTMVLVSHSPAAVEEICDRAMWIHDGTAQCIGSPHEVVQAYTEAMTGHAPSSALAML